MNIFKNKKLVAIALTFVIFMTLVQLPLPAKERRGATVKVTMTDGSTVKGELLAVKDDTLLVYDKDASQGKSIDLQQVAKVKVFKKSKILTGLAIGFGVGLGLCVYNNGIMGRHNGLNEYIYAFVFPVTVPLGGIIGALSIIPKKFSMDGISSYNMQENLKRLKRYAREQDLEKLVAD